MVDQFVQVFGEGVVVVACCWLAGFAEPSAVIGDDAVSGAQKNRHLFLPRSTAQWISVNQDNRLTRAVVLIIEIDIVRVFLTDSNVWHRTSPFSLVQVEDELSKQPASAMV